MSWDPRCFAMAGVLFILCLLLQYSLLCKFCTIHGGCSNPYSASLNVQLCQMESESCALQHARHLQTALLYNPGKCRTITWRNVLC